jgi:phosphoglucomutase
MAVDPRAGKPAEARDLVDVAALVDAYTSLRPDPSVVAQRVTFGTSGHRGSSLTRTFNEWHVLAISQAICEYRHQAGITGPLYIGIDTHALSVPAFRSALEVLAANGVEVLVAANDAFTPTPAISQAILVHNRGRVDALADGIVVTPSHNPPEDGGFKYNPANGGPADKDITDWIGARANALIADALRGVKRMPYERARQAPTTREHDFVSRYIDDLASVIDIDVIRQAKLRIGVDPLGGAGVHYWGRIAERYRFDLTVVNDAVDPTFRFMTLDWDGRIRMDPSSPYAMQRMLAIKDRFDIAFACDTDHDRHGIVTPTSGLMPPNHYLAASIDYLFRNRPQWRSDAAVGKTIVSSAIIDRVAQRLGRTLYEVPVGFKWFVDGLLGGSIGFAGEESAGATFLRKDGTVWTTDKDGIVPCLLAAEMLAKTGRDPATLYRELTTIVGAPVNDRVDAAATPAQKARLAKLSAAAIPLKELAGEPVQQILDHAPANDAPIGGVKVVSADGWFAARPSGTENIYKVYAESFRNDTALKQILADAQKVVDAAIAGDD